MGRLDTEDDGDCGACEGGGCFENMASIPSLRCDIGSMKLEDSVPIVETSFGTG